MPNKEKTQTEWRPDANGKPVKKTTKRRDSQRPEMTFEEAHLLLWQIAYETHHPAEAKA